MSTQVSFGGRIIKAPGVYSIIKSGITNPPAPFPSGATLLIDTGQYDNFSGGAGILGTATQGKKIYLCL